MPSRPTLEPTQSAKARLLDAAHGVVRRQGYAGTSVDDLCRAAGVTKGAFFHHFPTKEALAVAGAQAWTARAEQHIFTDASWMRHDDPLDRVLAHIDFRLAMIDGPVEDFTCFVGTMVQEAYASSDAIRAACDASITAYAGRLAEDIQQAIDAHGIRFGTTALELAFHIQAVLQGAFILAKSKDDPAIARKSVTHLKRYLEMLFDQKEEAMADHKLTVENVLQPGKTYRVDADKFGAMKAAILKVLPGGAPGLTVAELKAHALPHLPEALFPGGAKAGWWIKSVQLDLEAKGVIARTNSSPLRFHRA
jgi:TetR/AcrR family transcriptional regulator, transcriptional repressor for nem operon